MPFGPYGVLAVVMGVIFILGFFIDFFEICFIHVPILTPVLVPHFGFDPVWLGVLIGVNLQTSFLTPPFGFALFYLRGVAPPEITTQRHLSGRGPLRGAPAHRTDPHHRVPAARRTLISVFSGSGEPGDDEGAEPPVRPFVVSMGGDLSPLRSGVEGGLGDEAPVVELGLELVDRGVDLLRHWALLGLFLDDLVTQLLELLERGRGELEISTLLLKSVLSFWSATCSCTRTP